MLSSKYWASDRFCQAHPHQCSNSHFECFLVSIPDSGQEVLTGRDGAPVSRRRGWAVGPWSGRLGGAGRLPQRRQVADHVVEFLGIQAVGSGGGASFMPFLAASCANARMRALVRIFAFHCRSARARSPLRWDIYLPLGILVGTLAIDTSGICMKLRGICMKPVGVGFILWSRSCR